MLPARKISELWSPALLPIPVVTGLDPGHDPCLIIHASPMCRHAFRDAQVEVTLDVTANSRMSRMGVVTKELRPNSPSSGEESYFN